MTWLVGNKGMLGTQVECLLREDRRGFFATDRECDITNLEALRLFARGKKIDWIVNCSAYTAVDKAESEPDAAFLVNAVGPSNLARTARECGARLIHISTDYVFDGNKEGPYTEEDSPCPANTYGKSKAEGEKLLRETTDAFFIFRAAWMYGRRGVNFVSTMLRLFKERDTISVVDDQWGTPTYAVDLAAVLLKIIAMDSERYGIYHFTNDGTTSWYRFAVELLRQATESAMIDSRCLLRPINSADYPTRAVRPRNSVLSKEKIKRELGIEGRAWEKALSAHLQELSGERGRR